MTVKETVFDISPVPVPCKFINKLVDFSFWSLKKKEIPFEITSLLMCILMSDVHSYVTVTHIPILMCGE